ncbi:MAG: polysaccharide biosynthesis C-terminal domain-containing protein, partial [Lachnospiraceae bacterium]|nr:polysaccharide biosynthesis C-terminal domain-containing protein [Lachnospiraceae bacterium]
YFFGITEQLLLSADQKGYIQNCIQMLSIAGNTVAGVVLMLNGYSIHVVRLVTSVIFLMRPLLLRIYVNRHYEIDRKITYDREPIGQKWNGIAQHVAAFVLNGTDNIVLTIFASLTDVSIYSVYNMVILGVKNLFMSLSSGIQSVFGEMLAKKEIAQLTVFFGKMEWIIHTGVTFVFGCTAILIVPFINVYTSGITDAVYNVPIFAIVLTLGNAMHCLRLPYNMMILAGGNYKQTQSNYIIAALVNIIISIVLVKKYGLIGVAVGTLIAMSYQTVWMAYYDSKHLIHYPFKNFLKQMGVDALTFAISFCVIGLVKIEARTYLEWGILAIKISLIWFITTIIINMIFYGNNMRYLAGKIIKKEF